MIRLALVLLCLLSLPAPASAAPLGERPFADRDVAGCLAPTGTGLSLLGSYSQRDATTDLLSGEGARTASVNVGRLHSCAAVADAPGGAAVLAGTVQRSEEPDRYVIAAAIRDPEGAFGPAVELGRGDDSPAAAVAPTGHAVVAWVMQSGARYTIVAARRAPGAAFGPPEPILSWRSPRTFTLVELRAGVDAAGRVTLLWGRAVPNDSEARVEAASAAAGGRFEVQRLTARMDLFADPVLAVAADGWALAAHRRGGDGDGHVVFERAPGAPGFSPVTLTLPKYADEPVVAIRDGGGGLVAWRHDAGAEGSAIVAATRQGAGAFGAPRKLAAGWSVEPVDVLGPPFTLRDHVPLQQPPVDFDEARLRAAMTAGGRVLLAWSGAAGRFPLYAGAAHAVLGDLGGPFDPPQRLGGTLRDTDHVAPLFLPDGRAAVAWSDRAGRTGARLHVAVEGAPAPAAPPVHLRLRAPRFQRLFAGESPRVTAACSGPCDLRAAVSSLYGGGATSATRRDGGARRLDVGPVEGLRRRPQWVRVTVHAGPPGGRATVVRSLDLRLARRPAPPLRRPLRIRARRHGEAIVVTWRTAGPARRQEFLVAASADGSDVDETRAGSAAVRPGRGRTRFSRRLLPDRVAEVRWVVVLARGFDGDRQFWSAPVPVR